MTIADSVAQTRTVFSIAIMLSSSVLADTLLPPTSAVASHRPVWHNPCGASQTHRGKNVARKKYSALENEITPVGQRHPSARPLRLVRTQLRITYNHFLSLQTDIARVYSRVKTLMTKEYQYDWLPGHQFSWYRDNIRCLEKKKKVQILLPALHSALQNFSATFEELRKFGDSHHINVEPVYRTRRDVMEEVSQEAKKLLCEVEMAIINMGLDVPERISLETGEAMVWDSRPDHTRKLIQDWGVLTAYKQFLDDWMRIIRRLVGKKSNLQCKHRTAAPKNKRRPKRKQTRRGR